jgi:hypothetical protein
MKGSQRRRKTRKQGEKERKGENEEEKRGQVIPGTNLLDRYRVKQTRFKGKNGFALSYKLVPCLLLLGCGPQHSIAPVLWCRSRHHRCFGFYSKETFAPVALP